MIKLVVVQDHQTPASVRFYRTMGPVSFLEKAYPNRFRIEYKTAAELLQHEMCLFPYHAALIERPITNEAHEVVRRCKSMGVLAWVDYDDNLFQIPDYNTAQDFFSESHNMQTVQAIMQIADLVTVSTPHLQKIYGGMNKNVHLVPNAWCDYLLPLPTEVKPEHSPVRMAWRGGNKHGGDLYEVRHILANALTDAAFDWKMFGWQNTAWQTVQLNKRRKFTTLFSYLQSFIQSDFDFLFVPLQVNDFNISKSNCSWIEATLAGAVTIAPIGLPEFDLPGVIRYKDNAHLKKIFAQIKKGGFDKRERVQASMEALHERFRLSQVNNLRIKLLEGMLYPEPVAKKVEEHGGVEGK